MNPKMIRNDSYFQSLLKNLPDAVYFKDVESKFTACNIVQVYNLGASSEEDVYGKTDADFFGPIHAKKAREDEVRIMQERTSISNVLEKVDFEDGRIAWHSTSKAPIVNEENEVIGVLGMTRDVTETKEIQDKLEEANQLIAETSRKAGRSEVASIIIHNVGNILNSVNVTATIIEELSTHYESLKLNDLAQSIKSNLDNPNLDAKSFLEKIASYMEMAGSRYEKSCNDFRGEIERLQQDVSNIQRIIMLQQDMASFWKKPQFRSCESVIDDAIEINRIALQRHGVLCKVDVSATENWKIPEFQTLQVLLNFLSNGKYAFDGTGIQEPLIQIRTEIKDENVFIVVKDNGPGISPGIQEKIFELGYTTREGGHGIGLHSSKMAAQEIGGDVGGNSKGEGKGAEFYMSIPLTACVRDE